MPRPPYTIATVARVRLASTVYTLYILNWAAGGTQTGSAGQGSSEGEWREGVEGSRGGREGGSDDVRQGGSGSGGREGGLREAGLIMERAMKGRNEAWTERGK